MKRSPVAHRSTPPRSGLSLRTSVLWTASSRSIRPAGAAVLTTALVLVAIGSASAQPAAPDARQQAALTVPIVFTQVPAPEELEGGRIERRAGDPGDVDRASRLVLRSPDGGTRVLTPQFRAACDPDVSPDGQRILFAGRAAGGNWNIHEIDLPSMSVRQVTRNAGDCRSPIYTSTYYTITEKEPWEQIAFVSTLARQADERGAGVATSLYTCKLDGSFLQRISYNLASDLDPAIMPDGRLAYAAWRRATFDSGRSGRLIVEGINTDGSDRCHWCLKLRVVFNACLV